MCYCNISQLDGTTISQPAQLSVLSSLLTKKVSLHSFHDLHATLLKCCALGLSNVIVSFPTKLQKYEMQFTKMSVPKAFLDVFQWTFG